jgi:hypothetical protein
LPDGTRRAIPVAVLLAPLNEITWKSLSVAI